MNQLPKMLLAWCLGAATAVQAQSPASAQRLDEVAERGRHVMPFHLEKTLHLFNKTEHGGVQQVIVKDGGDGEQIALIRQHLADIAERFKHGDFSRQRRIHGDEMPGLADLNAQYRKVGFAFRELANGAEIEYSAEEPALVDAIHRYFNAQLTDHARHAVGTGAMKCEHGSSHETHHHNHQHGQLPNSANHKE